MTPRLLLTSAALSVLAALTPMQLAAQGDKFEPIRYAVIDLGTLGGPGTNSSAFDMNNAGWVAGSGNLTPDGPQHAFLWFRRGPLIDLGTLGGPNSEAGGPNARGEAAILSETGKMDPHGEDFCGFGTHRQCLAAVWRDGTLTPLPTLPGGHNAQAYGINNLGQVIGFSENGVEDASCATLMPFQVFRYRAVVWEPDGTVRKLRRLPGDTVGFAFGINDHGQAVGTSGSCANTSLPPLSPNGAHAVLWERDGRAVDLGTLGGASNIATSVNNRGDVVGTSQADDGTIHAFVWTKTTGMRDLGTFPGAVATVAPCCDTINNSRQVVGFWFDATGAPHPFLWQHGTMTDLNELISKDSPWHLLFAQAINDAGEIVGQGVIGGESHAFLAIPCDRNHRGSAGCRE
jgi:probable HAF family extracellular repeat protein